MMLLVAHLQLLVRTMKFEVEYKLINILLYLILLTFIQMDNLNYRYTLVEAQNYRRDEISKSILEGNI